MIDKTCGKVCFASKVPEPQKCSKVLRHYGSCGQGAKEQQETPPKLTPLVPEQLKGDFVQAYIKMVLPSAKQKLLAMAQSLHQEVGYLVRDLETRGETTRLSGSGFPYSLAELIALNQKVEELSTIERLLKE